VPSSAEPVYRKYSKPRKSLFHVAQIWEAADHLLLVTSIFAVEHYRRFYFHDIEAFVIRQTTSQRTWIIVNLICVALFGGLSAFFATHAAYETSTRVGLAVASGIIALPFFIGLIVQLALGPTCVVFFQLRTGLEKVKVVNRLRPALRMRDRLAGLMAEQAQPESATP
jgi:hypothetical protein